MKPCKIREAAPRSALRITVAVSLAFLLVACGDKKDEKKASQTAAKVNKDEITVHQINFLLQQQRGLRPEQAEAAGRQALERLIDQQLALQKADDLKVDRDPRVVQQLEAARREVISRAYFERIGDGAPKPSAEDVSRYYEANPALFKDRRIYSFQEFNIEAQPNQIEPLRSKLAASKSLNEFIDFLKSGDYKFAGNQGVRAAEQLPMTALNTISKLKDGQSIFSATPNGAQVLFLAGSRSQPVDLERARPAIEQFLLNERKRNLIADDMKAMRAAARIEYVGKFADSAPGVGGAGQAPATAAPAPQPAQAAGSQPAGLSAGDISKGLGIKK